MTKAPARAVVAKKPQMSEDDLLSCVIDLAQRLNWRVINFRPAQTAKGWRTAVQGDGKGYPDLTLLRGSRGMAVELKSARGQVSREQAAWLGAFLAAGWETHIWRPADWVEGVREVLT